jgi:hypothetical protein
MKLEIVKVYRGAAFVVLLAIAFVQPVLAQTSTATLHGTVVDPSGAVVADVSVLATSADGQVLAATTGHDGTYEIKNLAPGAYKIQAIAKGFAIFEKLNVTVIAGQIQKFDIALVIEEQQQKVVVSSEGAHVDVSPENNAGAIVLSGKELDALSDDPDELQSDLQALAGPSAGPNGGQMYIDGFTAGQLPPKSSIREIRINQNPFSSEYDKLGYGRIEIFTKPGTDKFHGQVMVMGNSAAMNSRNPFLLPDDHPSYDRTMYNGSVGGPLSKKASFFLSLQRRDINDLGFVTAPAILCADEPVPNCSDPYSIVKNFTETVPNSLVRTNISPRVDYQLSKNNSLSVRYQYWRNSEADQGIGGFSLPTQGYNGLEDEHTIQASDTQMFGSSVVNETRFQFERQNSGQTPLSTAPSITVQGSFTGGGSSGGPSTDTETEYELQNYTSIAHGRHFVKFGARLRRQADGNISPAGFNGSFTFASINAYQIAQQDVASGTTIPSADLPTLFQVTYPVNGTLPPNIGASVFDAGLYLQDDWRVRPNFTVSTGLRFETQNQIDDHADWAPRFALAWGIGKANGPAPKTVLRAGWGMFYDRFSEGNVMQVDQLGAGSPLQKFSVSNPSFYPTVPAQNSSELTAALSTIYRIDPKLRSPYTMQTALSLERQVGKVSKLSLTYLNSRGVRQLFTNDINVPEPGTYPPGDPSAGTRGNTSFGDIYQYESGGIFKENQFIVSGSVRAGAKVSLNGFYTLTYANGDTSGGFPSSPFSLRPDRGRTSYDVRNRLFLIGSIALPRGFNMYPFLVASSGRPYSVLLPVDYVGSNIYNQRPDLASPVTCSGPPPQFVQGVTQYCTSLGTFEASPTATEMPINHFTGAGTVSMNLRVSKTFGFGKKIERPGGGAGSSGGARGGGGRGPGGPFGGGFGGLFGGTPNNRPYNLTFSVNGRNIFNHVNLANPISTIGSTEFGQSNNIASFGGFGGATSGANRVIELQASFTF